MYLTNRFYLALTAVIVIIAAGYLLTTLFFIGRGLLLLFGLLCLVDACLLYGRRGIRASRRCSSRFSNGDDNDVRLLIESTYRFPLVVEVIDEVPVIFQQRDVSFRACLARQGEQTILYRLRPTHRGVYAFGFIRVFAATPLGLLQRRYTCGEPQDVKVYPGYLMLHQYEFLAIHNNLTEMGIKRIRRIGNNTEFEQIKDYVVGDDYRTINWRATARRHQLMTNVYQQERSQQVFCIVDKGRVMQQAFRGMTLLDYAVNASLVLSYVAIKKEDKAGLMTFADHFDTYVPAQRRQGQMQTLLDVLYAQQTQFGETDFSALCANVNKHVSKRSLLILFTNFWGSVALHRQLPYLQQLNRRHRLLVVFFEDTELSRYAASPSDSVEEHFRHVIAEKFIYEKRLIVNTLKQHGIAALLTSPDSLTVDAINKYLELRQ